MGSMAEDAVTLIVRVVGKKTKWRAGARSPVLPPHVGRLFRKRNGQAGGPAAAGGPEPVLPGIPKAGEPRDALRIS